MDEVTRHAPAKITKEPMSKEQRSKILSAAATRRWEKVRKAKARATKTVVIAPPAPLAGKKKPSAPREFSTALRTAEKRLAKALLERAEAAAKYAVLSAEIPSLQRLILALRNPLGTLPEYAGVAPAYAGYPPVAPTLEQIVGDMPLAYQNPPRADLPAQPSFPAIPVPQELHPAHTAGRAGGGAIGVPLADEVEDENTFLNDSAVGGTAGWH